MEPDGKVYVIRDQMGNCRLCGERDDLRSGVCFRCALEAEEGLPPRIRQEATDEQR